MAIVIADRYTENIPVAYDTENDSVFTSLAINILGESVLDKHTVLSYDEGDPTDIQETVVYYIKPQCSNMVASISWSLFLTTSLLVFGLIRSLFNAFSRGAD